MTFQLGDDRLTVSLDADVLAELASRGYGIADGVSLARLDDDLYQLEIANDLFRLEIYLAEEDLESLARTAPQET
jgi:hypothetical protein